MIKKIKDNLKKLDTNGKDIRNFGVLFALILITIVLLYDWSATNERYFLGATIYFILGISVPKLLKYPFLFWMSLSFVLGEFVFKILFTVFYFILIVPIGLMMRLVKGDFLENDYDKSAGSYWKAYDSARQKKESLENLF